MERLGWQTDEIIFGSCDGCKSNPIIEPFKCNICSEYKICLVCNQKGIHPHLTKAIQTGNFLELYSLYSQAIIMSKMLYIELVQN